MTQPRNPRDWESWLDQAIREAREQGKFDNLPGKGKPVDLTPNPFAGDQELAFKILKDAGYAPDWIELDKAIRSRLEQARAKLGAAREQHRGRLEELAGRTDDRAADERRRAEVIWKRAVAAFEEEAEAINRQIAELNLKVPSPRFQRRKVDVGREIDGKQD